MERGDWPTSASELPIWWTDTFVDLVTSIFRHRCLEAVQGFPIVELSLCDPAIWQTSQHFPTMSTW